MHLLPDTASSPYLVEQCQALSSVYRKPEILGLLSSMLCSALVVGGLMVAASWASWLVLSL